MRDLIKPLIGTAVLLLTLFLSRMWPWGLAPEPEALAAAPAPQQSTANSVDSSTVEPRALGARSGVQNLFWQVDTSARRTDRGGLL